MTGAQAGWLPDGRLHLQHGPIDLAIHAEGADRSAAFDRARAAFAPVLERLVADLPRLRRPVVPGQAPLTGIAGRMERAAAAHRGIFVTPMAAVAGAVADGVLAAMRGPGLTRVWVDNGGDLAFWLAPGARITVAAGPGGADRIALGADDPVRGVATSGWRGRSHSLGIADAVTVLAATAAAADVAATLIANAVDLPGHPAIGRRPARDLRADSDLGCRPVTVAVGPLAPAEVAAALDRGAARAGHMLAAGLIAGAALWLGGEVRTVGEARLSLTAPA